MFLIKPLGSIVCSQPLEDEATWSFKSEGCGGDGRVRWGCNHGEAREVEGFKAWLENWENWESLVHLDFNDADKALTWHKLPISRNKITCIPFRK